MGKVVDVFIHIHWFSDPFFCTMVNIRVELKSSLILVVPPHVKHPPRRCIRTLVPYGIVPTPTGVCGGGRWQRQKMRGNSFAQPQQTRATAPQPFNLLPVCFYLSTFKTTAKRCARHTASDFRVFHSRIQDTGTFFLPCLSYFFQLDNFSLESGLWFLGFVVVAGARRPDLRMACVRAPRSTPPSRFIRLLGSRRFIWRPRGW